MNLFFYRALLSLLSPFIYFFLLFRKFRGLESKSRFDERFGYSKLKRPEGKIIWFNAVSVGEINSAWTIVKRLNDDNNCSILITTTTVTSAEIVKNKTKTLKYPNSVIHQFVPVDFYCSVKRFLKHWKPDILINVESEFWPNLFTITKKFCPIFVLNGKMSKKSFRYWYVNKRLKEQIFDNIDICLTQSRNDYKRFLMLGVQCAQFIGNIKFFVDKSPVDEILFKNLKDSVKDRKRWLVNCTHEGEEETFIETHKLLKKKYNDFITFLVVRHPKRVADVEKLIKKENIKYVTASSCKDITEDIEFYIYDKMGNLGTFFNLCNIVFLAGSTLKGIGGHTPAEAIKHSCCVLTGPYIANNYNLFKDLLNEDACIIVKDTRAESIFTCMNELINNPIRVKQISDNAYRKGLQSQTILNDIIEKIESKIV